VLAPAQPAALEAAERLPTLARKGVVRVRPEIVAEVEYRGWTADDQLRHASSQGLREDKNPREVTRE
jgi:bifunctional non-homologous end joining protein LigD